MGNALRLGIARIGLAISHWRINRKSLKKTIVILIIGLQATGKSTIALRLYRARKQLPDPIYVQTKGFNTYEIRKKNLTIKIHDLGGHESVRELWTHYYADAHGIIFVVDSNKPDDLPEAGEILSEVLRDERMRRKPVLVLANKQDEPNAISEVDLPKHMDLVTTVNSVRCLTRIDVCAANSIKLDQGIYNGFKWLVSHIEIHYPEINTRVEQDSAIDQEKEKARFNLRRNEVRRAREESAAETASSSSKSGRGKNKKEHAGAEENANSSGGRLDEEEGIEQVQKPQELDSKEGGSLLHETIPLAKMRPEPVVAESHERLSPEGAADSTEDLKTLDTIKSEANSTSGSFINNNKSSTAISVNNEATTTTTATVHNTSNKLGTGSAAKATSARSGNIKSSSSGHDRSPSNGIPPGSVTSNSGFDNPAYEHHEEQEIAPQHPVSNNDSNQNRKVPSSKIPMRNRAFSIRSNSTETDIEVPGEIILVTTKAQVHESQELIDDVNGNSNVNYVYDLQTDRNVSPISYFSGHISHKTSQESIVSGVIISAESLHNSASHIQSRTRSSSVTNINEADLNSSNLTKPTNPHPTPLQKLANIKSRNKTAPMTTDDLEQGNHASNGNILAATITSKKKDNLPKTPH